MSESLRCEKCGAIVSLLAIEHVAERGTGWKCKCGWWNWLVVRP